MAGPNAEEATEDIALSTADSTKLLSRYSGTGWVVEQEIMHDPDEDPEQVGLLVQMEASERLSGALDEALGDDMH